jgi:hypothetical protein
MRMILRMLMVLLSGRVPVMAERQALAGGDSSHPLYRDRQREQYDGDDSEHDF